MTEESKNNALDKFIRSRVGKDRIEAEDWNTPPVSVLDNAFSALDQEKRSKRRFFWYWFTGGLAVLLIAAIVLLYNDQRQIDELNRQVDALSNPDTDTSTKHALSEVPANPEINRSENGIKTIASESTIVPPTHDGTNVEQENASNPASNAMVPAADHNTPFAETFTQVPIEPINAILGLLDSVNSEDAATQTIDHDQWRIALAGQSFTGFPIQIPKLTIEAATTLSLLSVKTLEDEEAINNNRMVYLLLGGNTTTIHMTSERPSAALTKYDQWYSDRAMAIGLKHDLGKVRMNYRLGLQHVNNVSQFSQQETYFKDLETTNSNGNIIYSNEFAYMTPNGEYFHALDMNLGEEGLNDQDQMTNITDIRSNYTMIDLALGAEFDLISRQRSSLYLITGFQLNKFVSGDDEVDIRIYYNSRMLDEEAFSLTTEREFTPAFLQASAGLGYQFTFARRYSIGLETQYSEGLTSIRNAEEPALTRSFMRQLSTGIQLAFSF